MASVLALVLTQLLLPWFNGFSGKELHILWTNWGFWLIGIGFVTITSLLAGAYPAFYLSGIQPLSVLKSTLLTSRSASYSRSILVVFQFTISIALILSTIIVYQQIAFGKDRAVGYERAGLIRVPKSEAMLGKEDVLRHSLLQSGVVTEVAESASKLTEIVSNNAGLSWEGKDESTEKHKLWNFWHYT